MPEYEERTCKPEKTEPQCPAPECEKDPKEELELVKEGLETINQEIEDSTKEKTKKETKRDALQAIVDEINKILEEYEKVVEQFKKDKKEIYHYVCNKKIMIEAAVPEPIKRKILDFINEVDCGIEYAKDRLKDAQRLYDEAVAAYEEAVKCRDERKQQYEALKAEQAKIDTELKELKRLQTTIEGYDGENKINPMYFLILELEEKSSKTLIKTKDELEVSLNNAWCLLDDAENTVKEKEKAKNDAQQVLTEKEEDYKTRKENREKDILDKISTIEEGSICQSI